MSDVVIEALDGRVTGGFELDAVRLSGLNCLRRSQRLIRVSEHKANILQK